MSTMIQVRTTQGVVPAKLVTENAISVWVQLPDGNVIKRNKRKHVVTAIK